jgi:hypothetical protein
VIGLITLLDLLTHLDLHTTDWFVFLLSEPPVHHQPISPTTSSAFLLAGAALRIKAQVGKLNRTVKDIAVAPELAEERDLPTLIQNTRTSISDELTLITQQEKYTEATIQLQQIRTAMLALAQGKAEVDIPFLDHPRDAGDMAKTLKLD